MKPLCDRYTAAWRLFHLQFDCMAPEMSAYGPEYLRKNYMNVSGNRGVDKLRLNQMQRVRLTPAAMAMYMAEGQPVGLVYYHDCVQIYADVQKHISDWRDQCSGMTHASAFPAMEELRMFEALALEVHVLAKKLEPKEDLQSRVFDELISMSRRRNLTGTNKWLRQKAEREAGVLKPYVSVVDEIERYVVELS